MTTQCDGILRISKSILHVVRVGSHSYPALLVAHKCCEVCPRSWIAEDELKRAELRVAYTHLKSHYGHFESETLESVRCILRLSIPELAQRLALPVDEVRRQVHGSHRVAFGVRGKVIDVVKKALTDLGETFPEV